MAVLTDKKDSIIELAPHPLEIASMNVTKSDLGQKINIMFWNINKNNNLFQHIIELIEEYEIDIFVLAEFPENSEWLLKLPISHKFHPSPTGKIKVKYIYNNRLTLLSLGDAPQLRGSILSVQLNGETFNLVGCHLVDAINYNPIERENRASDFSSYIQEIEKKADSDRTIVVGDFNMNPFDPGMARAKTMNSVMNKEIALKGKRTYCGKDYPYFYNPMWYFLGHPFHLNGTIYYHPSEDLLYYWHLFDQVLVRPSLINNFEFDSLKIIDKTKSTDFLTKNGIINKNISDHLPIFFTLNL